MQEETTIEGTIYDEKKRKENIPDGGNNKKRKLEYVSTWGEKTGW